MMNSNTKIQEIDDDIKRQVASILGIELSAGWKIDNADQERQLYLVHYNDKTGTLNPEYTKYRGTVVSLEHRCIVADSFGATPIAISKEIIANDDGKYPFTDNDGQDYTIPPANVRIVPGFDGTLLRMFKVNGKVYLSSHRRLDIERSRWGNETDTFSNMYSDLNGPASLFDDENPGTSPYCHFFMLVHPQMVIATRFPLTAGFLVYIGHHTMWDPTNPPMDPEEIDLELRVPDNLITDKTPQELTTVEQPFIYQPREMSLDEANCFLTEGYWSHDEQLTLQRKYDERLGTGEFIILYGADGNVLRVHSPDYEHRTMIRGNTPNLYCQFVRLFTRSGYDFNNQSNVRAYANMFPFTSQVAVDQLKQQAGQLIVWPSLTADHREFKTRDGRYCNIWRAFLMSVPLHRQAEVVRYWDKFHQDQDKVISWIISLEDIQDLTALNDELARHVTKRVKEIISETRRYANEQQRSGRNRDNYGRPLRPKQLVKRNIRNLIHKEYGESLYQLIKNAERYQRKRDELAAVADQ